MDGWKGKIRTVSTEILDCRDCHLKGGPIIPCFGNEIDSPDTLIIGIEPKPVSKKNSKRKDYIPTDVREHWIGKRIENVDHLTEKLWEIMSCEDKDEKGRPKEQLGSFYREFCGLRNVVITDAIKCPNGKARNCRKWLKEEVSILRPKLKLIIAVGKCPKKMVNNVAKGNGIEIISIPHPALWKYDDRVSKAVICYYAKGCARS